MLLTKVVLSAGMADVEFSVELTSVTLLPEAVPFDPRDAFVPFVPLMIVVFDAAAGIVVFARDALAVLFTIVVLVAAGIDAFAREALAVLFKMVVFIAPDAGAVAAVLFKIVVFVSPDAGAVAAVLFKIVVFVSFPVDIFEVAAGAACPSVAGALVAVVLSPMNPAAVTPVVAVVAFAPG